MAEEFQDSTPVPGDEAARARASLGSRRPRPGGADGWAMTHSGTRGVLNEAPSIHFLDATLRPKIRFAPDSPLEGAVRCELVSAGGPTPPH